MWPLTPGDLVVLVAAGGSLAVGGLALARYLLSPRARRRRLLKRARPTAISEARDGALVKLVGRVRSTGREELLVGPLSGREGISYEVKVEVSKGVGEHATWEQVLDEGTMHEGFWLEEERGGQAGERAYVELQRVELELDRGYAHGGLSFVVPEEVATLLAARGVEGVDSTRGLRFREGMVELGQRVAVLGRCVREPDPRPPDGRVVGYRERPTRVRVVAGGGTVVLSDAPT